MDEFTKFIELVTQMLEAQKTYFTQRTQTNLVASKRLESQVRREITRLRKKHKELEQKVQAEQQTLWVKL